MVTAVIDGGELRILIIALERNLRCIRSVGDRQYPSGAVIRGLIATDKIDATQVKRIAITEPADRDIVRR